MTKKRSVIDITRMSITDYTEYEFSKIIDYLYECQFSDEWQKEAAAMFEHVVAHPDGMSLIYDGDHPYIIYEDLKEWYKEKGLPFVKPDPIRPITDYTEKEFLAMVKVIRDIANSDDEKREMLQQHFLDAVEHPNAWDIIRGKKNNVTSPEGITALIKQWYKDNKKPCFKNG